MISVLAFLLSTSPAFAADGEQLYRTSCAVCHGMNGDGQGHAARYQAPRPRDFTTGLYKFRTTPLNAAATDDDIKRTIRHGIPGTTMPSWDQRLSDAEMGSLVDYLRTFATQMPDQTPIEIPEEPLMNSEAAARGEPLFQALCSPCHGATGRADGPGADGLTDAWGHPIRPANFSRGVYKSGPNPQDLFRTIKTGLQGTPMVAFGTLPDATVWDLVAYIRSLSKGQKWERGRVPAPPKEDS